MGKMKELYTLLHETEEALREYDPLAFDNAKQIIEAAQAIALTAMTPHLRSIKPREDQTPISFSGDEPAGPTALPTVTIGEQEYYVDERLRQLRNIENPHDFIDF
jgi:hypothetical protein